MLVFPFFIARSRKLHSIVAGVLRRQRSFIYHRSCEIWFLLFSHCFHFHSFTSLLILFYLFPSSLQLHALSLSSLFYFVIFLFSRFLIVFAVFSFDACAWMSVQYSGAIPQRKSFNIFCMLNFTFTVLFLLCSIYRATLWNARQYRDRLRNKKKYRKEVHKIERIHTHMRPLNLVWSVSLWTFNNPL